MKTKLFFLIFSTLFLLAKKEAFCMEFSEISLKDTENDWIEIEIKNPLTNSLKVQEDSIIIEIQPDLLLNKKFILIFFKSDREEIREDKDVLQIFVTKKGLTGTTEQLTLESNGEILDKICWQNSNPPESELEDIEKLGIKCLNSEKINKNESIAKINDIWEIINHPTPGVQNLNNNATPTAKISIQKGSVEGEIPFSLNLDGSDSSDPDNDELTYHWEFPNKIIEKKNPPSYRFEKTGEYQISLTVKDKGGLESKTEIKITALEKSKNPKKSKKSKQKTSNKNGNLSNTLEITEIFPNPKGKDQGNEWIEIHNMGDTAIDLGNWQINKKRIKNLHIKENEYAVIKMPLKNDGNVIQLKNFNDQVIDEVAYKESKEAFSYSKMDGNWYWTDPTPGNKNYKIEIFEGIVLALSENKNNQLICEISRANGKIEKIVIIENLENSQLYKTLFTKNSKVQFVVQNNENNKKMLEFKILAKRKPAQKKDQKNQINYLPIILTIGSGLILYYTLRR